jgi:hypothetical protein
MDTVARLILRLLLVPLGAAVAITVSTTVIVVAHWSAIAALAGAQPDAQGFWLIEFLFAGPMLALLLSLTLAFTVLPAGVGVLISEALAIRSWIYHAANGGLSAWIGWSMMQDIQDKYRFLTEPKVMVAAGLAGGLAYWLVAGWTAGFWKPVFAPEPQRA